MKSLIIRQPWIEFILSGQKTWEMRSKPNKVHQRIGLIEQGTGLIVGEATIWPSLESVSPQHSVENDFDKHRVSEAELLEKWCYPWPLTDIIRYENPIKYSHPKGAVIWVNT